MVWSRSNTVPALQDITPEHQASLRRVQFLHSTFRFQVCSISRFPAYSIFRLSPYPFSRSRLSARVHSSRGGYKGYRPRIGAYGYGRCMLHIAFQEFSHKDMTFFHFLWAYYHGTPRLPYQRGLAPHIFALLAHRTINIITPHHEFMTQSSISLTLYYINVFLFPIDSNSILKLYFQRRIYNYFIDSRFRGYQIYNF